LGNIVLIGTKKKSDPDEYSDPRSKHIQQWVEASDSARKKQLGENFMKAAEDLYGMQDAATPTPSFRPAVSIPMLQRIMLEEANQISNLNPQIYIFSKSDRDKEREKALQAEWCNAKLNQHFLMAGLTARYCGSGWIVSGFDPDLGNGRGGMWAKSIDPRYVFFDPTADYTWDPSYSGWGTWMNLEDVRLKWPYTSKAVKARRTSGNVDPFSGESGYGIEMPPGPMQSTPGAPGAQPQKRGVSDSRVLVRHVFCKDYTRELVEKKDVPEANLIEPEAILKYPNGRWLVECEGVILHDDDSPYAKRTDIMAPRFPLFPLWVLPPLFGAWGIPVTRMTVDMQRLAQRFYTQVFENAIRINNGVWFIDQNTNIDTDSFGGLAGEVQMINNGSRVPQCVTPNALSGGALTAPKELLNLQNQVLGFTEARQGNPGAGNVSTDLFDSSVLQSSGLLQLAGRMLTDTVQMVGEFFFYTMGRYKRRQNMPFRGATGIEMAEWEGVIRPDEYDVLLDEASIRPLSDAVVRRMTPDLMKTGIVSTERGLSTLGYPGAEEIAKEQKEQLELAALARVKGAKK
jgi:hypothetical protein